MLLLHCAGTGNKAFDMLQTLNFAAIIQAIHATIHCKKPGPAICARVY